MSSRRIIAWRMLPRSRSNAPNDWGGTARSGAVARGFGGSADGATICGGGAAGMGGGTTGSRRGVRRDGGASSAGVVTRGGRGCTQPRLVLGFWAGGVAGVTAPRWRTGGGGRVPGGAPSASRKRRIRSSSLCAGGRGGACSLGEGGSGFSESSETCRVSHLKISASPARTRKMSVSFIATRPSALIVRHPRSTVFPWHRSIPASSCPPARSSFARNP